MEQLGKNTSPSYSSAAIALDEEFDRIFGRGAEQVVKNGVPSEASIQSDTPGTDPLASVSQPPHKTSGPTQSELKQAEAEGNEQKETRKRYPPNVLFQGSTEAECSLGEQADEAEEHEESSTLEAMHPRPSQKCFYGPLGEITEAIAPHTEADRAAILMQLLIGLEIWWALRHIFG